MNEAGLHLFEIETPDHKWWVSAEEYLQAHECIWKLEVADEFDVSELPSMTIRVLSEEDAAGLTIENLEDETKPFPIWPMHEAATETTEHGSTMWRA